MSNYSNGNKMTDEELKSAASKGGRNSEAFQKSSEDSQTARKANQQAQMKSNIFGGGSSVVDGTPSKSGKSHVKSNIFETTDSAAGTEAATPRRSNKSTGNPITGEGYSNGSLDGQRKENCPSVQKSRQPPGGHSSKLW